MKSNVGLIIEKLKIKLIENWNFKIIKSNNRIIEV